MSGDADSGTVVVLDCDPDLGQELADEELRAARAQSVATQLRYERGLWQMPPDIETTRSLGLLITHGFIVRELTVGEYTSLELLGPGDVLQPWVVPEFQPTVMARTEWTVIQRMLVASLDGRFLARVSRWPELIAAISRRLTSRTHWLLLQLALSALRRVDDRLVLVLWQFADRWGTVTPHGVLIDIPLTHELLAASVGARRPSVSAAIRRIVSKGQVRPLPRSRWLLLVPPPDRLRGHDMRLAR